MTRRKKKNLQTKRRGYISLRWDEQKNHKIVVALLLKKSVTQSAC